MPSDTPTHAVMAPLLTGALFRPERYHFVASLDSTNRWAARLAREGAPQGTVVAADQQRRGRGRSGRHWSSPPGRNLYFSVVLRPLLQPRVAAQLTLLAGLAVAKAVAETGAHDVEIKWPNDLLLHGRKLAGILTEMRADPHGIQYVIVGVGINVHGHIDQFPVELRGRAISLAGFLRSNVQRPALLASVLTELAAEYQRFKQRGLAALRSEWLAFARLTGRQVFVRSADVITPHARVKRQGGGETGENSGLYGIALDLDDDGFLLVQQPDGTVIRVVAGDVTMLDGV